MINEDRVLAELNNHYCRQFDRIVLIRDGGSLSYLVHSKQEQYFLRIVRPQFLDTALQSVDIHMYLYQHQIPVPAVILTNSQAPYILVDHLHGSHLYVLYEYIEGYEPDVEKEAEQIGSLVGRFHRVMQGYTGELVRRDRYYFIDRYIEILRKKQYPEEKLKAYTEYGHALWEKVKDLPCGYSHGDLHRGNLHQTPDGSMYLLDFDTSCLGFPVYDVMMVCNCTDYFAFDDKGYGETRRIYQRFLTGYLQFCTLSGQEQSAIYDLLAVMHFQLQANIIGIYGMDCVDEKFIDDQLDWLFKWREQCQKEIEPV